jgi:hypothetical protein
MTIDTPLANFEAVTRDDLYQRHECAFYSLTPAKGARVEATISVGISSDDYRMPGTQHWEPKAMVPAMWVDYTPDHANESYSSAGGRSRETMTVNGKEYGEGFGASVSGRVEFIPAQSRNRDHLAKFYRFATVGGTEYYVRGTISYFDHVSDKAREVLNATVEAIAIEYVTDERWHAHRVTVAERKVQREREAVAEAQAKLEKAQQELDGLK